MMNTITPEALAGRLAQDDAPLLLDVREQNEFECCHLPNALHIPMNQIPIRQNILPDEQEIVVYCHHGVRSAQVIAYLIEAGFAENNLYNLSGGIDAWAEKIDSNMPRY